jgi:hypothetical protein
MSLSCRMCGYDLGAIGPATLCPECGASVAWSSGGYRLENSEPRFLRRVSVGVRFVQTGVAACLVFFALGAGADKWADGSWATVLSRVAAAGATCASMVLAAGLWLLLATEPHVPSVEAQASVRCYGRLAALGFSIGVMMMLLLDLAGHAVSVALSMAALASTLALAAAAVFAVAMRARRLCLRADDPGCARRAARVGFGMAGILLGLAGLTALMRPSDSVPLPSEAAGLLSILLVASGVVMFNVLTRLRTRVVTAQTSGSGR